MKDIFLRPAKKSSLAIENFKGPSLPINFRKKPAPLLKIYKHRHNLTALFIFLFVILTLIFNLKSASSPVIAQEEKTNLPSNLALLPFIGEVVQNNFADTLPRRRRPKLTTASKTSYSNFLVGGWLLNGAEDNFSYLKGIYYPFSELSLFWLEMAEDGVSIKEKFKYLPVIQVKKIAEERNIKTYVVVTASPNLASIVLGDASLREKFIENLMNRFKELGFTGLEIDFEMLEKDDAENYLVFLKELKNRLAPLGLELVVDLEARLNNEELVHDWQRIGEIADKVRIMGYDYHSRTTSSPGPISPVGWVQAVLEYALSKIPAQKIFLGLPLYGYDWSNSTDNQPQVKGLTIADISQLITEKKPELKKASGLDERGYEIGKVPYFTYQDDSGTMHTVWFEDKESLLEKIELAKRKNIKGIYFWRLNAEENSFWQDLKISLKQ